MVSRIARGVLPLTCCPSRDHRRACAARPKRLRWPKLTSGLAATTLLVACGGETEPSEETTPADTAGPLVLVEYPSSASLTDTTEIELRGSAADDSRIVELTVNGTSVDTSSDFQEWSVRVPLELGPNELVLAAVDEVGNVSSPAATRAVDRVDSLWQAPKRITMSATAGAAFVVDGAVQSIVRVDLETGAHVTLASPTLGTGPVLSAIAGIDADTESEVLYATDSDLGALVAVDATTGARTLVSDATHGTGPALGAVGRLTVDTTTDQAYAVAEDSGSVLAIDLATGNRTVLSSDTVGAGPPLVAPAGISFDATNARLLVTDLGPPATVVSIDLGTGDRTLVSGDGTGVGVGWSIPPGIRVSAEGTTAYVSDVGLQALVEVELTTGDRVVVSDAAVGSGPELFDAGDLALEPVSYEPLVVESGAGILLRVSRSTGARATVSHDVVGSGPTLAAPLGMGAPAHSPQAAFVADELLQAIVRVPLYGGADRQTVSDGQTGSGPAIAAPRDVDYVSGDLLYVIDDAADALFTVSLGDGTRTILSDASHGAGPTFPAPRYFLIDCNGTGGYLLDTTEPAILFVDLATGDRTTVSSGTVGTGPTFDDPTGFALAWGMQYAYVSTAADDTITAVEIATGNRQALATCVPGPTSLVIVDSSLFAAGADGIYLVSTVDGDCTPITTAAVGSGPLALDLDDLIIDDATATLYAASSSLHGLLAVDIQTGERSVVAK